MNPEFLAGVESYYSNRMLAVKDRLAKNFPILNAALDKAGVAFVKVRYDGSGDSGQIDEVELLSSTGTSVEEPNAPVSVYQTENNWSKKGWSEHEKLVEVSLLKAVEAFLYDLLELRNPGWEINEGSFGEFEWKVRFEDLEHTHNERVTEINTTHYQGFKDG